MNLIELTKLHFDTLYGHLFQISFFMQIIKEFISISNLDKANYGNSFLMKINPACPLANPNYPMRSI
jgi:hypothetical protein